MAKELNNLTIAEASKGLKKGSFSAVDLTESCLSAIDKKETEIGAFLEVFKEDSLNQAKKIDQLLAEKKKLPSLAGIPLAIKDNILIKGYRCSAASRILENYVASYDATVIDRLKKEEAVFLGKTNLDEFAMGSSTENSAFHLTRNPHDLEKVPGGSSGGSAAAVAAGEALGSLGSDTGGSVRQPAAFCGLVGLKPTYGAVSRYGLIAFASSLDQIGPLTKTTEDSLIIFKAISGQDDKDATSRPGRFNKKLNIDNLKIGVPSQCFQEGVSKEMIKWTEQSMNRFKELGARVVSVDLPSLMFALPAYYVIAPAEASTNLARYDGLRYGTREKANSLKESYTCTKSAGFGPEVKRRIMLGTYTLSSGHYEAYYQKAQKTRQLIRLDFEKVFQKVDIILTPTTPTPAFSIGEKIDDPVSMYLSDLLTTSANLAGLPAVSIPVGKEGSCPIGMQLIGAPFSEEFILSAGHYLETPL